jgi:hypothetical protein
MCKAELDPPRAALQESNHKTSSPSKPLSKGMPGMGSGSDSMLVNTISIAADRGCRKVHDVLCAALADFIDKEPMGVVHSVLVEPLSTDPGCSIRSSLERLAPESAITVLAAIRDLNKAVAVRAALALRLQSC